MVPVPPSSGKVVEAGRRTGTSLPSVTFSLVARSDDGRLHGVVVASRILAAGALVPGATAEVGAIATQAGGCTAGPGGRESVSRRR
jgi:hypothetical protein